MDAVCDRLASLHYFVWNITNTSYNTSFSLPKYNFVKHLFINLVGKPLHNMYTEPKWKLYTFIIQISNTVLNLSSLLLYKIGHITKPIIWIKFNSFIKHNREITHIVKTDSWSKTQLIVRTKCSFCCHLSEVLWKHNA